MARTRSINDDTYQRDIPSPLSNIDADHSNHAVILLAYIFHLIISVVKLCYPFDFLMETGATVRHTIGDASFTTLRCAIVLELPNIQDRAETWTDLGSSSAPLRRTKGIEPGRPDEDIPAASTTV